jgi:Holliday junction resolvase RusA-like endonuclease
MFRNVRGVGRVRTKHYDDWRAEAGWRLRLQRPGSIGGHVTVAISVEHDGGASRSDIDNRVKALLDLLVSHQVIEDDSLVVGLCAAWAPPANRLARVRIAPAGNHDIRFVLASDGAHGGYFFTTPNEDNNGDFPEFDAEHDG